MSTEKTLGPTDDPDILGLREQWPTLSKFQIGERINCLLRRYSTRKLAKLLPPSAKGIRDYKELAEIPWFCRPRTRKVGTKKLLQEKRKHNKAKREWQKLMTGPSGARLQRKLEATLKQWMMANMSPWFWDKFLGELLRPFCRQTLSDLLERNNPDWTEIQILGDWDKIIASTRPKDIAEHEFEFFDVWLLRWLLRCMPVGQARAQALRAVRQQLRGEAKKICREAEAWFAD